ncbi:SDR family NAD(P)-dependent oxidoreductase [Promicromonospora sp. Populi]|uniref:SDR family NAD(P)-dependent oxidoreductase n=1 Tax=Promicromonospora sp. Populi TaxID=3239420 RepID=UPI0034E1BEAE
MALDLTGTTTVVTGASSGIGTAFARTLAARGSDLVLVARRIDRLTELADALAAEYGVTAHPLALDLTDADAVGRLRTFLDERNITVDSLVNNAGFATHGPLLDADPARIADEVRLNVAVLVELTHALLPQLTGSGRGFLVNVASTSAFQPTPGMAVYGATKTFVLNFTEALAYELRGTSLRVTALCPGPTRTEFFDVAGTDGEAFGPKETPAQVVATAFRALDGARTPAYVISGLRNRLLSLASRLAPRPLAVSIAAGMVEG